MIWETTMWWYWLICWITISNLWIVWFCILFLWPSCSPRYFAPTCWILPSDLSRLTFGEVYPFWKWNTHVYTCFGVSLGSTMCKVELLSFPEWFGIILLWPLHSVLPKPIFGRHPWVKVWKNHKSFWHPKMKQKVQHKQMNMGAGKK